jgi:hypothetical protein
MPGLGAAPGGRVGLVDHIALLQCACVLLASARLKGCAALTVVAGLKLVTIGQYEKGLAGNAHGFLLVSGFKDHNFLSCGPFLADFWLTGQNSAGDVPGTVVAAEGGDGHGSRVGVPGLPACAHPTPCAAMVNPTVWRLLRTCHNPVATVPAWHQRTSST